MLEPSGPCRIARRRAGSAELLSLEWPRVAFETARLCVRVELRLIDGDSLVRSTIQVRWDEPDTDWRLAAVHFPVLRWTVPPMGPGALDPREAYLVRGWEQGLVYRDPMRTACSMNGAALPGPHPGPHPLQVQAFGHGALSELVYLQTTDQEGHRKDFRCRGDGRSLELWVEHPAPGWDTAGNDFDLPFEVRLGLVPVPDSERLDPWSSVARAYREWAEGEASETILRAGAMADARADTTRPHRLRAIGRTFTLHCRDTRDAELAPHDLSTRVWAYLETLERWSRFLGAPPEEVSAVFARWHRRRNAADFGAVPATAEEAVPGLRAAVEEARRRGFTAALATSPIVVTQAEATYDSLISQNGAGVKELAPGHPPRITQAAPGSSSTLACLGDPRAIESYTSNVQHVLDRYGIDGVYLDAFTGPPVRVCSGGHLGDPHLPGGGSYFHRGREMILERIAPPGTEPPLLVSETLDELLLGELDGVSMLLGRNISGGAPQGDWVRAVPLWPAVYHAYQPVLGFFADSLTQTFDGAPRAVQSAEAWQYLFALHFLAGSRLGFADDLRNLSSPPRSTADALSDPDSLSVEPARSEDIGSLGDFLRELYAAQSLERSGSYLLLGDMQAPIRLARSGTTWRVEPQLTLLAWASYRQPTFVPVRLQEALSPGGDVPAILSSHWRSRTDDSEAWIFVNWTTRSATLEGELRADDWSRSDALEWQSAGSGHTSLEASGRFRLSLPGASLHRIELRPRRR
ncbi:MAG: DUF6259 domain-containing protein [Planctomycetota bacterium]